VPAANHSFLGYADVTKNLRMDFKARNTALHLRAEVVEKGASERMRAIQALSYGYGTGSQATLSALLLASLGGPLEQPISDRRKTEEPDIKKLPEATVGAIAMPMQSSANDNEHGVAKVNVVN